MNPVPTEQSTTNDPSSTTPEVQDVSPPPSGTLVAHLRAQLPALTPAGRRIGTFVLDHPRDLIHLTVTDTAERTATSVGSIVRFCQDLGLRGFQDLKIRLATETASPTAAMHADVLPDDPLPTVLAKVLRAGAEAMSDAAATVSEDAFRHAVDLLGTATRVLVVGVGTSATVAADAAYRLRTTGLLAEAPADVHVQHVTARLLTPADACLAVSHTGQTRETLATATAARDAGAATVAVTSFSRSPLTKIAGAVLVAGSRETAFRVEAMSSRLAHTAVLDALCVALALTHPDRARAAQSLSTDIITEHRV